MHLAQAPGDMGLRLAALYPLRRAGLSNVFQGQSYRYWHVTTGDELKAFKRLVGLCVTEKLNSLIEFKFELHNVYLAAAWDEAREIFSRMALLGLLPPAEMHALRGQFWFLSVFGRQIEYEMSESDLLCDWVYSLPEAFKRDTEFSRLARPELLQEGSPQHQVLVAWCTNPRPPEPIPGPEPPRLAEDGLLFDPSDRDEPAQRHELSAEGGRELPLTLHHKYRDFKPVTFGLTGALKDRLVWAVDDLRLAEKSAGHLGARYRPLVARAEFALGNFIEAGAAFDKAFEGRFAFGKSETTREDYAWEILFSSAWSYRLAGNYEQAVATLRKGLDSKSPHVGLRWWVAKWYSECGKYAEAAEELRRESEDLIRPPDSWLLSSILALAAVAEGEEDRAKSFGDRLRRDSPEIHRLLHSIVAEQWPRFEKLQADCRTAWLYAVWQTYLELPIQGGELHNFRAAIYQYGWILERELRSRIFERFRERVLKDQSLNTKSIQEHHRWPKDDLLCYLQKKQYTLTLGKMIKIIEDASSLRNETEGALVRWLQKRFPNLNASIPSMKKLNSEWRRVKHETPAYQRSDVVNNSSLCKEALAWL
jgi:tetratricopeptide (TPR) repeat protein